MGDFKAIGTQFTQYYYSILDTDRTKLSTLYRENSLLTFEGEEYMGAANISAKYINLPFQKVLHQVVTCDVQPVMASQGILVFVNGNMVIDDSENPMKFAQVFHLLPDAAQAGNYYVSCDVFRLNLG